MGISCYEVRDLLIIDLYGKATAEQAGQIQEHVRGCQACRRVSESLKAYKGMFEADEEIPLPNWAKSWDTIQEKALKRRQRSWHTLPRWRPLRVAAALALTLAVGFVLGRWFFSPVPTSDTRSALSDFRPTSAGDFAEQVDLLLVDFMNKQDSPAGEQTRELEQKIMEKTLLQTRLLKMLASRRNDAITREILEDVEFALVSISNMRSGDERSAGQLYDFLYRSRLRLRLHEMAETRLPI